MAKKIIKEPTIRRYKATCPICGCEFEFDTTDFYFENKGMGTYRYVDCPKCECEIMGGEEITDEQ